MLGEGREESLVLADHAVGSAGGIVVAGGPEHEIRRSWPAGPRLEDAVDGPERAVLEFLEAVLDEEHQGFGRRGRPGVVARVGLGLVREVRVDAGVARAILEGTEALGPGGRLASAPPGFLCLEGRPEGIAAGGEGGPLRPGCVGEAPPRVEECLAVRGLGLERVDELRLDSGLDGAVGGVEGEDLHERDPDGDGFGLHGLEDAGEEVRCGGMEGVFDREVGGEGKCADHGGARDGAEPGRDGCLLGGDAPGGGSEGRGLGPPAVGPGVGAGSPGEVREDLPAGGGIAACGEDTGLEASGFDGFRARTLDPAEGEKRAPEIERGQSEPREGEAASREDLGEAIGLEARLEFAEAVGQSEIAEGGVGQLPRRQSAGLGALCHRGFERAEVGLRPPEGPVPSGGVGLALGRGSSGGEGGRDEGAGESQECGSVHGILGRRPGSGAEPRAGGFATPEDHDTVPVPGQHVGGP